MSPNFRRTWSNLRTIIHYFCRKSDHAFKFESPGTSTGINVYCKTIQAYYSACGVDCMRRLIVLEIQLLKSTAASKHEYLSIKVLAPNDKAFYLAIERGRGIFLEFPFNAHLKDDLPVSVPVPPEPVSPTHPSGNSLPPPTDAVAPKEQSSGVSDGKSSPLSLKSVPPPTLPYADPFSPRRHANDNVSRLGPLGKHHISDKVYQTLSFPEPSSSDPSPSSSSATPSPQPLRLYELATLAKTIHEYSQKDPLFNNNRYFFSGTIIKMVEELYHPKLRVTLLSQLGARFRRLKASKDKKQAGNRNRTEFYNEESVQTDLLISMFKQNLEAFEKPVREFDEERKAKDRQLKAQEQQLKAQDIEIAHLKLQLEKVLGLTSAA